MRDVGHHVHVSCDTNSWAERREAAAVTNRLVLVRLADRRRLGRLLGLLVVLMVAASACSAGDSDAGVAAPQPAAADEDAQEPPPDQTEAPAESSSQDQPAADGSFGPKPLVQTFQVLPGALKDDGSPVDVGYTFTSIDSPQDSLLYIAIGDASGVRAAVLDRGVGEFTVCGNTGDGCGTGTSPQGAFGAVVYFDLWHPTLSSGQLRTPASVELNDFGGWELVDESYSNGGRPGNCYRSTGQDETGAATEYPAGDVACTVKHDAASQFLVSYDYGGDGIFEIDTISMQETFGEADLVLPPAAAGAGQAGLDQILANLSDGYDFLG